MKYENLTLHQRISLKGLFTSEKERRDIGLKDQEPYNCFKAIMVLWNFKLAIEYFLNNDVSVLREASMQTYLFSKK